MYDNAVGRISRLKACAGVASAALAVALFPGNNQAQAQESKSASSGEVIVTAQKRSERLRDVPIAISVVNPQLLENTNARNLAELNGVVPNMFIAGNSGGGRTYVTLRGATGLATNLGDEPVAVYVDDIYMARGVTIGMTDLLDVGSIEIVRGPQGTLQGRNATAGAFLIRSADPTPDFHSRLTASFADPQEYRTSGMVSGPLGGGFEGRAAIGYVNEEGWAFNPVSGRQIGGAESLQARAVLTYDKDGPLTGRLVADHARITNEPAIFRYASTNFLPAGSAQLAAAASAATANAPLGPNTPLSAAERKAIFDDNIISLYPGTRTTVRNDGVSGKLQYALDGVDLVSVTGYRKVWVEGTNDSDGIASSPRMGYNHNDDRSKEYTQEFRVQSSGDQRLSWILGGYYFHEDQPTNGNLSNLRLSLAFNQIQFFPGILKTRSWATFGDATLKLTEQLSVIGGIRYTEDKKNLTSNIITTNLDTNVTTNVPNNGAAKWHDTSYRGKVVFKPNSNTMLFVGYGKGFRAGSFNINAVQPPYEPEYNKSWEAGAKGDLFNRTFSYSLAAFHNDYKNMQLRAGVPTGGAIITNAAASVIKGVEAELTARPTENTRLNVSASYTDGRFKSFPTARDVFDRQVNASGNLLPRTPRWQYFLSAEQDFALDALKFTAEVNYRWRDKVVFFFTDQTSPTWQDPSASELGARLTARASDKPWSVSVYGTNLTNERSINTNGVVFSYPEVGLNKPRVIGASLQLDF